MHCHNQTTAYAYSLNIIPHIMGLSTRVLKPDSQDPDSRFRFNVVSWELHTACRLRTSHFWTGIHALLCALSRSTARSSDSDWGRVEAKWSLNSDPQSASDLDPMSRVESPMSFTKLNMKLHHTLFIILVHVKHVDLLITFTAHSVYFPFFFMILILKSDVDVYKLKISSKFLHLVRDFIQLHHKYMQSASALWQPIITYTQHIQI